MPFAIAGLDLQEWLTTERLMAIVRAVIVLVAGLILARVATAMILRFARRRADAQQRLLLRRLTFYPLAALVLVVALGELGFHVGVLMGAAGLFTVALGFASQTSASNLISGLFLIIEQPFVIGDIVRVEDVTGEVLSIDLLSIKLRTFDNLFVRVPNETIIKTKVINLTHFPIRRIDLQVGVAYKEDLPRVREVLAEVADRNPLCLDEPAPVYIFKGFGESSLDMQFSVWTKRENYLALLNSIYLEIKAAFDAAGIEIPFPHRSLYTGSVTDPFPIRIVERESAD
ncbi:MAG: mechanosensitive ion channel family protein [Candidatus Krumholzibacteriia bacterium]|nr:mechanosensitive ion channel family protein [Candidatus Latescibacterota bacterium]